MQTKIKLAFAVLLALILCSASFAQDRDDWRNQRNRDRHEYRDRNHNDRRHNNHPYPHDRDDDRGRYRNSPYNGNGRYGNGPYCGRPKAALFAGKALRINCQAPSAR
jgi:hypothetical protein